MDAGWRKFQSYLQPAITLGALVGLQLPCLVSRATPNSALSAYQQIGFPFNMSPQTLDKHFSFSPLNLSEGRCHTLITNVFNHSGVDHFSRNMNVLLISGFNVHRMYGRRHTLVAFFGGGVAGNLSQYVLYLHQKINWKEIFPSPKSLISYVFGEGVGKMIDSWQRNFLGKMFSSVNAWRPCIGASAAIGAFISIEACSSVASLIRKFQRVQRIRDQFTGDFALESAYELLKITVASLIVYEDAKQLLDHSITPQGVVGSLVGYAEDGIGHAAHLGGFLFGFFYYIFVLYKVPQRIERT